MRVPPAAIVRERLRQSYALDRLWWETIGQGREETKERALRTVIELLERTGTHYALVGGVAVQIYSREPRTTLNVEIAIERYDFVPRMALGEGGFTHEGRGEDADLWRAPGPTDQKRRTAIEFWSAREGIEAAVARAHAVDAAGFQLRLASAQDLLILKLAAAEDTARRPTRRRLDLMDVIALAEEYPEGSATVPMLRERVDRLSSTLMILGSGGIERDVGAAAARLAAPTAASLRPGRLLLVASVERSELDGGRRWIRGEVVEAEVDDGKAGIYDFGG